MRVTADLSVHRFLALFFIHMNISAFYLYFSISYIFHRNVCRQTCKNKSMQKSVMRFNKFQIHYLPLLKGWFFSISYIIIIVLFQTLFIDNAQSTSAAASTTTARALTSTVSGQLTSGEPCEPKIFDEIPADPVRKLLYKRAKLLTEQTL